MGDKKAITQAAAAQAQVDVDWTTEPAPVHANFASISSSAEDFAIVFCSVSPSGTTNAAGNRLGRVVSSVRVSPATYFKVVLAMADIWNRFADQNLTPETPRFRQGGADGIEAPPEGKKK